MDEEIDLYCGEQFSEEALDAVNRDELSNLDMTEASVLEQESLLFMERTRRLALSQGIRFRFVSHKT